MATATTQKVAEAEVVTQAEAEAMITMMMVVAAVDLTTPAQIKSMKVESMKATAV